MNGFECRDEILASARRCEWRGGRRKSGSCWLHRRGAVGRRQARRLENAQKLKRVFRIVDAPAMISCAPFADEAGIGAENEIDENIRAAAWRETVGLTVLDGDHQGLGGRVAARRVCRDFVRQAAGEREFRRRARRCTSAKRLTVAIVARRDIGLADEDLFVGAIGTRRIICRRQRPCLWWPAR